MEAEIAKAVMETARGIQVSNSKRIVSIRAFANDLVFTIIKSTTRKLSKVIELKAFEESLNKNLAESNNEIKNTEVGMKNNQEKRKQFENVSTDNNILVSREKNRNLNIIKSTNVNKTKTVVTSRHDIESKLKPEFYQEHQELSKVLEDLPPIEKVLENPELFRGPTKESNWVIPGRLLAGAYPLVNDSRRKNKKNRYKNDKILGAILDHGITTFVCLQKEYKHSRKCKNSTLHPYIIDARDMCRQNNNFPKEDELRLLHLPIKDCCCTFDDLVLQLSTHLSYIMLLRQKEKIYVHCWGGHGRTGTIIAVTLGLLYNIKSEEALKRTQVYHDVRLSKIEVNSPQTAEQCQQVRRILNSTQAKKIIENLSKLRQRIERKPLTEVKSQYSIQRSIFDLKTSFEEPRVKGLDFKSKRAMKQKRRKFDVSRKKALVSGSESIEANEFNSPIKQSTSFKSQKNSIKRSTIREPEPPKTVLNTRVCKSPRRVRYWSPRLKV